MLDRLGYDCRQACVANHHDSLPVGLCSIVACAWGNEQQSDHSTLLQEWSSPASAQMSPWHRTDIERRLAEVDPVSTELTCDLAIYTAFLAGEGKEMFVQASLCEASIEYLKLRLAGRFGPVLQSDIQTVMCSTSCMDSDVMHQSAMERSHCSCTQLSTDSFISQDFCRQNSGPIIVQCLSPLMVSVARLLCSILGVCGTWGCGLHDFMCPRYDWDRLYPCAATSFQVSFLVMGVLALAVLDAILIQ
ncbi:hypothetical protein, variant 2 [Aphanomyces astaci]|uniref:Uncharacterized protein n=2 Tax=Aphanomyces astaci TaxID=112090 RepID=W4H9B1_APHAT|nr:hypothetical protein, variant 2 [Aphanomyces astaci]ETV87869.1 hypothetical protein, variant 2 [Aphanomyces astaci]|eukprot:XP_009822735.1 hypothetical protein, variant 2 [Aphanomyces astaci]